MFEKLFRKKKEEKEILPEDKEIKASDVSNNRSDKQEVIVPTIIADESPVILNTSKKTENIPYDLIDTPIVTEDIHEENKGNNLSVITQDKEKIEIPPLTEKEFKALKNARYEQSIMNNPRFKKAYVLLNKKTKQIVEIRAASSFHACNIIGWKPKKVRVLQETDISDSQPETVGSSRAG